MAPQKASAKANRRSPSKFGYLTVAGASLAVAVVSVIIFALREREPASQRSATHPATVSAADVAEVAEVAEVACIPALLDRTGTFSCGDRLERRIVKNPSGGGGGTTAPDELALHVCRSQRDSAQERSIPAAWVDDGYCDCPGDGSDEITTAACSRLPSHSSNQRSFSCVGDPDVRFPLSVLRDGFRDCCDGSDEWRFSGEPFSLPPDSAAAQSCRQQILVRKQQAGVEAQRLHAALAMKVRNYIPKGQETRAAIAAALPTMQEQLEPQVAQLNKMIEAFNLIPPESPQKPLQYQTLRAVEQRVRRAIYEFESRRAMVTTSAFGPSGALAALVGKCFNVTIHEKTFRGGSAEPEQFNFIFMVCPFGPIFQFKHEGSNIDGTASGSSSENLTANVSAPMLLGYWTGLAPANFSNMPVTAIDPLGVMMKRGSSASAAPASATAVHIFSGGEPCWEGPERTVKLVFECGGADEVHHVFENGKCSYEIVFRTPAACTAPSAAAAASG